MVVCTLRLFHSAKVGLPEKCLKKSDEPVPVASDALVKEERGVRCWLDAKGRAKLILTPVRHVRSLFELSDNEMMDLFQVCGVVYGSVCWVLGLKAADDKCWDCDLGNFKL